MLKQLHFANHILGDAMLSSLRNNVLALASASNDSGEIMTGVRVIKITHRTFSNHCFDRPMAALTIQGTKLIEAGPHEFELEPGDLLVTCVDMPSISSIPTASAEQPYLGLIIYLDRKILAEQMATLLPVQAAAPCASIWKEKAGLEYLDIFRRIAAFVIQHGRNSQFMPLLLRELHLRLLTDPHSELLRSLYWRNTPESRLSEVINWLRSNIPVPINMEELAKMANMSLSSFHRHFKAMTGSSPLQYHKKLRLYEAQRLLLASGMSVGETAHAVGYESLTQFNREYRRLFGEPPARDITRLRKRLGWNPAKPDSEAM